MPSSEAPQVRVRSVGKSCSTSLRWYWTTPIPTTPAAATATHPLLDRTTTPSRTDVANFMASTSEECPQSFRSPQECRPARAGAPSGGLFLGAGGGQEAPQDL